jgi:hypothetical protein
MKSQLIAIVAAVLVVGCGGPPKTIWEAADKGNIEAVKQYLDGGVDVNAIINNGTSPLHLAALNGHMEVAELLIAKGADVNAMGGYGRTPLDWATSKWVRGEQLVQFGTEIADLLRKHGGKTSEELKAEGK